jgi:predicted SAM-dependent methyltransferase
MPKINIGAGNDWYKEGWESLENGKGDYSRHCQHYGKAWDSGLPSNNYDILFAANILEHLTHFKVEKTIAEFNRIMKIGSVIRIIVPDLKKAAAAYINNDLAYFENPCLHSSGHLGMGSRFMHTVITPGYDVTMMSREFDEVIGSYAHTYGYDFEMLEILLKKWGFGNIVKSEYCGSAKEEMREEQHIILDGVKYELRDSEARKHVGNPERCWISGFDNNKGVAMYVEAEKVKNEPYEINKEFEYNRRGRADDIVTKLKVSCFKIISKIIDATLVNSGVLSLLKRLTGRT